MHGNRNATFKNLGTWAGFIMLLSEMYWEWTSIFHFQHFLLNKTIFYIYLKIEGEGLNAKKVYLLASVYIRKFNKNCHLFWGYYIKRREGRKKSSLHKKDNIAIFAMSVLRSIALFLKFWLVTGWRWKNNLKTKYIFISFMTKTEF